MKKNAGCKKRIERLMAALLCAALLACSLPVSPVFGGKDLTEGEPVDLTGGASEADAIHINNELDFVAFAKNARLQTYSTGKSFILECDIDLSGYPGMTVPYLDGYFEGRGHKISGLSLAGDVSDYGLFRYIGVNGAVYDLRVEGEVTGGEDQRHTGILAGSNAGLITRCTAAGIINAQSQVGGIVGFNEETGVVSHCRNEASVDGKYQTGGIAGLNDGNITGCENRGAVNNNPRIKKASKTSDGDAVNISIPNAVTGFAADERANESGGIAGRSKGNISFCKNSACVGYKELGSDSGGIAGRVLGCVQSCENSAVIYGRMNVGGIAGFMDPFRAVGLDRDYYEEIRGEFDDLSDAIDKLSESGRRLGNDLTDNLDDMNARLDELRYSVRSYIDGYDSDLRSARRRIGDELRDMEDIVDDMDYSFRFKKLKNYERELRDEIKNIAALLDRLRAGITSFDDKTARSILALIAKYEAMLARLDSLSVKLEQLLSQMESGNLPESSVESLSYEERVSDDAQASFEEERDERRSESLGSEDDYEETEPVWDHEGPEGDEGGDTGSAEDEVSETQGEGDGSSDEGDGSSDKGEESSDKGEESGDGERRRPERGGDRGDDENESEDEEIRRADTSGASKPGAGKEPDKTGYTRPVAMADTPSVSSQLVPVLANEYTKYKEMAQTVDALGLSCARALELSDSIAGIVEKWPRIFREFTSDMEDIADDAKDIHGITGDLLNSFEGRTDIMKADVRSRGDDISGFAYEVNDTLRRDYNEVADDIDTLTDRFESVRLTLREYRDDFKSIIEDKSVYVDVSENDDTAAGDGKLLWCKNTGEVYADTQAGGIVGCVDIDAAKDKAVDVFERFRYFDDEDEDDEDEDDEKDSLTRHVRAVIYECENSSDVYAESGYAGGVAGKASYGVISHCSGFCDVSAGDGKWAGGLAGLSKLAVYDSYFIGGVDASSYAGGVAGSGENIAGNVSCAYMDMDTPDVRAVGAVAGKARGDVRDNIFVDNGYGAVDGITKSGEAEGMTYERLVSENELPLQFTGFSVRFMDGDMPVYTGEFKYGDEFPEKNWPALGEREGEYYYWENKQVSPVRRNVTVHSVRRVFVPSVSSERGADSDKAFMIFGGEFYPDSELHVSEADKDQLDRINEIKQQMVPGTRYVVTKAYRYELFQEKDFTGKVTVRALNTLMPANMVLLLDDEMAPAADPMEIGSVNSYAAFEAQLPQSGYVVLLVFVTRSTMAVIIFVLVDALLILLLVTLFLHNKRKQRRLKAAGPAPAEGTGTETGEEEAGGGSAGETETDAQVEPAPAEVTNH